MLRGMVLQNFVHFEKRFVFDFSKTKNSPNIFVGASSTGKTAVLELIRRCMHSRLNSSLTNRAHSNERAYVFCEFYLDIDKYGPTVITGMIVDANTDNYSSTMQTDKEVKANPEVKSEDIEEKGRENKLDKMKEQGDEQGSTKKKDKEVDRDEEGTMFHKVIMYTLGEEIEFRSESYLEKRDGKIVNLEKDVDISEPFLAEIHGALHRDRGYIETKENQISKGITDLFDDDFVVKVLRKIGTQQIENKTNHVCQELWRIVEEQFVGILPTRGLGTIQWTKSKLIESENKAKNYEGTCVHAEIITELLDSDLIDKKKEQEIFSFLTNPSKIVFRKEAPNANRINLIQVKNGMNEFPLLKTSVGIIEAKQFSLIMAHRTLKTICLEEPDRGMHPQMIERIKEVLHHESRHKTIIVVTHSPYLIDSMSLENIFFFSRKYDVSFDVVNIYDKLESNKYLKIVKMEDLKAILFSSKVLFVEGRTDKSVLEAIFRHLIQRSSKTYEDILPILSHEICSIGGKELRENISEFCNKLNIKFCLVLDRDAIIETEESTKRIKKIQPSFSSYSRFEGGLVSDFLVDPNGFKALSTDLAKKENTFIWRDGDLEDFLLSSRENHSEILSIFKPDAKFTTAEDKEKYNKMKTTIKKSLKNGCFREKLDALADIITNFSETERLCSFLKDI